MDPVLVKYKTEIQNSIINIPNKNGTGAVVSDNGNNYNGNLLLVPNSKRFRSPDAVVKVENLCKSYEKGKPVLNKLCMNVRRGTIYSLLGSSGCGKTSLLSCIVGLTNWDSGAIFLFNKKPVGPPGRKVGYMPQHLAIVDQLSIREVITYYGRLYGMQEVEIYDRYLWLMEFLQLPTKFRVVKDLSGGQKMRVSLAVSLVHSPQLLILDEPTVGLDPLLRESIWDHLLKIVETQKTTVIITTHYIEETRRSNTVGIIRKGGMLVEDSPENLLKTYNCNLLEDVVLKLCKNDSQETKVKLSRLSATENISQSDNIDTKFDKRRRFSTKASHSKNGYDVYENSERVAKERPRSLIRRISSQMMDMGNGGDTSSLNRIRATTAVLWHGCWRHPLFMTAVILMPTINTILSLLIIGTSPKELKFGIVNDEGCFAENGTILNFWESGNINSLNSSILTVDSFHNENLNLNLLNNTNYGHIHPDGDNHAVDIHLEDDVSASSCDVRMLSCRFIAELHKTGSFLFFALPSIEAARQKVMEGELFGYFDFAEDYSDNFAEFMMEGRFATNETIEGSRIHVTMDLSNYIASVLSIGESFQGFNNLLVNLAESCGVNRKVVEIPLEFRDPIYGFAGASFHAYAIPTIIMIIILGISLAATAQLIIMDRSIGNMDRSRVAGLRFKEVILSHFLTQCWIIIIQTVVNFIVLRLVFGFTVDYSVLWVYFLLCLLAGLLGQSLGLLIGSTMENEAESALVELFIIMVIIMWNGAAWPVEQMSEPFRTVAKYLPTKLVTEAIRAVAYKGLGPLHQEVWLGIVASVVTILVLWTISLVVVVMKRK